MEKTNNIENKMGIQKDKTGFSLFSNHSRREFLGSIPVLCGGIAFLQASGHAEAKENTPGIPLVKIPERSIFMSLPESALYGITPDEKVEITLNDVIMVHGFCVGGGTFSFRAAQEAFAILYGDKLPVRHKIQVKTSHHCCQAAALAHITGARKDYGAFHSWGNLILLPVEEKKIIFIDKPSGKTVTLKPLFNPHDTFEPLFKKTKQDPGFAPEVSKVMNEKIDEYLNAPIEKLFIVEG
jgi:hypothetical protein